VVEMLLVAGADPNLHDSLGCTALLEAVKAGNEEVLGALLKHGARLDLDDMRQAELLCQCVHQGDLPRLRWGAQPTGTCRYGRVLGSPGAADCASAEAA
jgi:ankyrin repeat protein